MKKTNKFFSILLSLIMIMVTIPFASITAQAAEYREGDTVLSSELMSNDMLYKGAVITMDNQIKIVIDSNEVAQIENSSSYTVDRCLRFSRYNKGFLNRNAALEFRNECRNVTNPTCTSKSVCMDCGMTKDEPLGHSWKNATCQNPKTCTRCNKTEGKVLAHSYIIDDDGVAKCKYCSTLPPERSYGDPSNVKHLNVGDMYKAGTSFYINAQSGVEIDFHIDGVGNDYYNTSTSIIAENCVKCATCARIDSGRIYDVALVSNCLYTEPTDDHPATCVYCGKQKDNPQNASGSTIGKGDIVIIAAMGAMILVAMIVAVVVYQKKRKNTSKAV